MTETALVAPAETAAPALERKELGAHSTAPWKIRVLAECPAKFYLGAIAKDPRRKESGFEGRVGTLLHHGIEQCAWLRTWVTLGNKNGPLTPDELVRGIDQLTNNPSVEAARRDPAALSEARVLAKKVAKHVDLAGMLVESFGTKLRPLVEEPWTLDVGEVNGHRVVVGGIWDLVRRGKGGVIITDWKKGGEVRGTDELRLDPAATLYAAAAKARWPKEHVRVEHYFLTRGFATGLDWTPEVDEWARSVALEHARAALEFERAGAWPATPSLKACGYCSFRATCSAYRERVTRDFTLGMFDPSKGAELEAVVRARAKANEDAKLLDRFQTDLDLVLEPALTRAAEVGEDELVVGGHRARRARRSTHAFEEWRTSIRRLWQMTGIAPEELEDALLTLKIGALDELLATRGYPREDRERIRDVLEKETGTERSSSWIEVRPLADPIPSIDVERLLRDGVRVELPPPAAPTPKETPGAITPGAITPGAQDAGPGPQAAPAPSPPREATTSQPPAGASPPPAPSGAAGAPVGGVSLPKTDQDPPRATSPGEVRTERDAPAPAVMESGRQNPEGACAAPSGGGAAPPAPPATSCAECGMPADRATAPTELDVAPTPSVQVFFCSGPCRQLWRAKRGLVVEPAEPPKESAGFTEAALTKPSALAYACACGRSFQNARGLSAHRRSCPSAKGATS